MYNSLYKNQLILDNGTNKNHLRFYGVLNKKFTFTPNDLFLPIRLEGEYKSLVHEDDSNIIEKYYEYNPDILENSDIFFHDVLTVI